MSARENKLIELEGFALELAHTAGGIAEAYFRSHFQVDNKDDEGFDPVTSADHAIEKVLRETIQAAYPDHDIVAEESDSKVTGAEFCWYIDPIDGTRAFLMGSPLWGTLVGLTESGRAVFGLLAQPVLGELFFGSPAGSWLIRTDGRERLESSQCTELGKARLASTHPGLFAPAELAAFDRLAAACLLDRFGGDCYNYAMLAAGFVDVVAEVDLKPFDIVPLVPILENAGCTVTTWDGGSVLNGGSVLAAASPKLHAEALELLNS
ncbi:MAG TPA: inositol monophosphatase family protein [Gammaproteobacteria bacterium]|jgi:myo-inositol-1(or 4)-monophosphatase